MPWIEQARLLLEKARNDAVIVRRSQTDPEIADEIAGFHVQQAAEKCFKAVLCTAGVPYRRTHDLQELHDLLSDAGIEVPPGLVEILDWSPYAVEYRYGDWFQSEPMDRGRALELVEMALRWAESLQGRSGQ